MGLPAQPAGTPGSHQPRTRPKSVSVVGTEAAHLSLLEPTPELWGNVLS